MRLDGKIAVVTGGARGIGEGIGKLMLQEGAEVFLVDLQKETVEATADALGEKAHGLVADVSDPASIEKLFAEVLDATGGRLDILVNCAGIGTQSPFIDTPLDLWNKAMAINLTGTFLCSQHAARAMTESGGGSIVNIASISGSRAGTGRTVYGTTKAGIIHLTKQMAIELASRGIRANAVSPGPVETELTRQVHTRYQRERYYAQIPQQRYGTIEEIAHAVLFLASEEASYITGHNIDVDGGFMAAGLLTPEDRQ
ncbi:MAG: SDR family NAD(P)-dependent oxidoreductase [Spirochaetaceae bacterium]